MRSILGLQSRASLPRRSLSSPDSYSITQRRGSTIGNMLSVPGASAAGCASPATLQCARRRCGLRPRAPPDVFPAPTASMNGPLKGRDFQHAHGLPGKEAASWARCSSSSLLSGRTARIVASSPAASFVQRHHVRLLDAAVGRGDGLPCGQVLGCPRWAAKRLCHDLFGRMFQHAGQVVYRLPGQTKLVGEKTFPQLVAALDPGGEAALPA
jgi:hypothetical protein